MSTAAAIFTPQDLAAQAAKVFDAVRQFGRAEIRTQEGETFEMKIKPETDAVARVLARMEAHRKRLRELGHVPPPASAHERINQIIAGEV